MFWWQRRVEKMRMLMEMQAVRLASWDPRLELELCQELASIIPVTSGKASGCILPVS